MHAVDKINNLINNIHMGCEMHDKDATIQRLKDLLNEIIKSSEVLKTKEANGEISLEVAQAQLSFFTKAMSHLVGQNRFLECSFREGGEDFVVTIQRRDTRSIGELEHENKILKDRLKNIRLNHMVI